MLDIYHKRKRLREKAGQPDVYRYDDLPEELRVQVIHIWRTALGIYKPYYSDDAIPNKNWVWIHDRFCRELGLLTLEPPRDNAFGKCCKYILDESDIDNVLSLIELSFRFIDRVWRERFHWDKSDAVTCPPKIGPLEMRDSCRITTGGNSRENKKVFGGAGQAI